ncbi:hypothetical protein GUITHDRAFT_134386 [Guillardia theta CCMP2712]|uniref:Lon N-terminal domain-containing protein n=1 Tax=Guillardia theta (strain CCMP2712) TaxID=905079 RepID=L1JSC0_GUITC|nr:hypothetical protein GUITHDRAFT_134386 [Guillardia theta CCMP2712]EKX51456.1 hypothetical protein GUITHDRAFT_134386 [Guillardia theta CCMP2712]|eukprot:XP_005838436.1 hypothetical protein GUITHDRAFT_134386 [Guillardia theta CCMP2712]
MQGVLGLCLLVAMAGGMMTVGATMGEESLQGKTMRGDGRMQPCAGFVGYLPCKVARCQGQRRRCCLIGRIDKNHRRASLRSSQVMLRMTGSDEWMFTSAKGYDASKKNAIDIPVLVKVFGEEIFPGEEKWISASKPSDELLLRETLAKNASMAYVSGANSREPTGGNVGFLSGSTAILVKVVAAEETRSLVRAFGRLQLLALVHDKPYIVASAVPKRDAVMTARSVEILKSLQEKMTKLYEEYKQVQAAIVKKRFEKKMEEVRDSAFLADIPFDEHMKLVNSTARERSTGRKTAEGILQSVDQRSLGEQLDELLARTFDMDSRERKALLEVT